ncbi:MAG: FAD-binding oxidoreductase [Humidesulfovibrio sp.]|nr:FAD-binding oxidoreductase [Humidesulfovibrio sp.]
MVKVSSWGRLSYEEHALRHFFDREAASTQLRGAGPGICFGMGHSYGDVCLNPGGALWNMAGLNRFIAFDEETGVLTCEAGVLLRDIQRLFVPRGFMVPVNPGTQLITLGGGIANDVHGKNHHRHGSFGDHVLRLRLARTDGSVIDCGPEREPGLFAATLGGIGLTGAVIEADIRLRRVPGPFVEAELIPFANLDEFFALADASEAGYEHTVSWLDCVWGGGGRGIFMRGNPSASREGKAPRAGRLGVPFVPPVSLVNSLSLRLFNMFYYAMKKRAKGPILMHHESFFCPLDNVLEWNRIYGPRGFYQYQSVIPREHGREATQAMLGEIARSGNGSFLAVLKTFGDRQGRGMLSFPRPGVTLALDFPNKGASTLRLFERLDAIVREAGGRLYLAKDARMPRDLLESGYPRLAEFLSYRDPGVSSAMSRRLMGV